MKSNVLAVLLLSVFASNLVAVRARAEGGMVPSGGVSSTLKASPQGKAMCPLAVKNSTGTTLAVVDCSGHVCLDGATCSHAVYYDGATYVRVNPGGNVLLPATSTTGPVTSQANSGSNAFVLQTNGARIDLGTGTNDYFSSDGSTISTPGAFKANGIDVTSQKVTHVATGTNSTDAAQLGQVQVTFGGYIPNVASPQVSPPWLSPASGATVIAIGYSYLQDGVDGTGSTGMTWFVIDHSNSDTVLCTGSLNCAAGGTSTGLIASCTATLPAGHQIEIGTNSSCGTGGTRPSIAWQVQAVL